MEKLTREEKQAIRAKGLIPRIMIYLFGTPKVKTRKGTLKSKRVWGIMLLVAISVITVVAGATYETNGVSRTIIEHPKTIGVLNMVATLLTTIGILAFRIKTFGLAEVFGELDD